MTLAADRIVLASSGVNACVSLRLRPLAHCERVGCVLEGIAGKMLLAHGPSEHCVHGPGRGVLYRLCCARSLACFVSVRLLAVTRFSSHVSASSG
jgi:hypothetical protein